MTTDHISPAGAIKKDSPAGEYLIEHGVEPREFNSYGSRRGNHEVMMRGTFANIRLRNLLAPDTEGGFTKKDGEVKPIYDAALEYHEEGTPLCVIAGQGVRLRLVARLGGEGPAPAGRALRARRVVRAHPPLEPGRHGHPAAAVPGRRVGRVARADGRGDASTSRRSRRARRRSRSRTSEGEEFEARVRIDTPNEWLYYRHDGILHYVLRDLLQR